MSTPTRKPAATAYTTAVILASAQARDDLEWLHRRALSQFEFRLLAAASQSAPTPPAQGWYDLKRSLHINVTMLENELRLSLQAQGYAALQRVAGRGGQLVSPDRAIDVHLRFDAAGYALIVLANSLPVRHALEHFHLILDDISTDPTLHAE